MNRMRVLVTLSSLQMGGAETNVARLLPYFCAEGVEPILCTLGTRPDNPRLRAAAEAAAPRFSLGARRLLDPGAFMRFFELIRRQKVDIIHAQDDTAAEFCYLATRVMRMPWVYTRHITTDDKLGFRRRIHTYLTLRGAQTARYCIVVCEAMRQLFHRQAGVPLDRIGAIYNGIDAKEFDTRHKRDMTRARLGWRAKDVVAVVVAVIRKDKGHDVVLEALPRIQQEIPNIRIKIVGDGPYAAVLRREAAHLDDLVEFMGQRDDVPELLGAADVLLLPSRTEALPTVLIEAGAAGLPVVATDVGGTREIVEDGITGFVVPPDNAPYLTARTLQILLNPTLAQDMGEAARARIDRLFTLDRQACLTSRLYQQVMHP